MRSIQLATAESADIRNPAIMHFRRVCLESFGYTLPDEVVTTAELERRLAPLYERLRLPEGRLELMTGIRERRFFPPGTRPSTSQHRIGPQGDRSQRHRSAIISAH